VKANGGATRRLVRAIQRHLSAIYRIDAIEEAADFLLDEKARARLAERDPLLAADGQLLLLEEADDLWLGVYLPERVRGALERLNPYQRLDDGNLAPFLTAVEETSHFLYVLWNHRHGRPVTRLELELQAEVDKFAAGALLLAGQRRARGGALRGREFTRVLFEGWSLSEGLEEEAVSRYRTASRLASLYCRSLEARYLPVHGPARIDSMLHDLRAFYRRRYDAKIQHIRQN
jgi:hypothetical protein